MIATDADKPYQKNKRVRGMPTLEMRHSFNVCILIRSSGVDGPHATPVKKKKKEKVEWESYIRFQHRIDSHISNG